ncbi:hypothetical protein P7C73_g6347, partial [Tremellales sp. Uapishka_1]
MSGEGIPGDSERARKGNKRRMEQRTEAEVENTGKPSEPATGPQRTAFWEPLKSAAHQPKVPKTQVYASSPSTSATAFLPAPSASTSSSSASPSAPFLPPIAKRTSLANLLDHPPTPPVSEPPRPRPLPPMQTTDRDREFSRRPASPPVLPTSARRFSSSSAGVPVSRYRPSEASASTTNQQPATSSNNAPQNLLFLPPPYAHLNPYPIMTQSPTSSTQAQSQTGGVLYTPRSSFNDEGSASRPLQYPYASSQQYPTIPSPYLGSSASSIPDAHRQGTTTGRINSAEPVSVPTWDIEGRLGNDQAWFALGPELRDTDQWPVDRLGPYRSGFNDAVDMMKSGVIGVNGKKFYRPVSWRPEKPEAIVIDAEENRRERMAEWSRMSPVRHGPFSPTRGEYFDVSRTRPGNSTANQLSPKGRRQPISCHACRKGKLKCNGDRPCVQCVKKHIDDACDYEQTIRRRGRGKKQIAEDTARDDSADEYSESAKSSPPPEGVPLDES